MILVNGSLLKAKMAERGLTITKLAELSNISRNTVSNLLNGKSEPSLFVNVSICYALDLTSEERYEIFLKPYMTLFQQEEQQRSVGGEYEWL